MIDVYTGKQPISFEILVRLQHWVLVRLCYRDGPPSVRWESI